MDLCTLAQVKAYAGIGNSSSDAILQALIDAYSQKAYTYCGRNFDQQEFVETRNGNGATRLMLVNGPVVSIASVLIDQTSIGAAGSSAGTGWRNVDVARIGDGRMLLLQGYRFRQGYGNVVLTYTSGYPVIAGPPKVCSVPLDLAQAVIELVALRYKSRDWTGYNSKGLAGETVSFVTADMQPTIKAVFDSYKVPLIPI